MSNSGCISATCSDQRSRSPIRVSVTGDGTDQDRVLLGLVRREGDTIKRLADAMYGIQQMRSPTGRQQVLDLVRAESAFNPRHSDRDLTEINNFIEACRDDDESFDLLLKAISTYAGESDPGYCTLQKLVKTLLPRAELTKSELHELLSLQPDEILKADQLAIGIRMAWPQLIGREGRDKPCNVREAALLLLDSPPPREGLRRLLRFVNWLARLACDLSASSKAERLLNWAERVGAAHGLTAADWRISVGSALGGEPALLIKLEPTVGDRFAVYLWLWVPGSGPGSGPRTLEWDENPCRLDELRGRLDDLLELASQGLGQTEDEDRLWVEFLLDLEVLNQDVDCWLLDAGEKWARPLGAEYVVIVRRQRSTAQEQRYWQGRWKALNQAAGPVSELVVWVSDAATLSPKELWYQLDDAKDKVLIAPLGTREKLDGEMKALLTVAIKKQGMPVALCLRDTPADAAWHLESLRAALADARLADLPQRVRTWRKQAFHNGGDHFGHHLVLLWDDYDRRLLDAYCCKLALPAVRGADQ